MKWLKRHLSTIFCILIFLVGACLLAYPQFSNWWNQQHQSRAIASYQDVINNNDAETNAAILAAAEAYNETLLEERSSGKVTINKLTDDQIETYNNVLDASGTGIMGYVTIPKIDVELPIYHGTDEAVLQIAIGHIEGTSLPVGGKGTHAVLSGHRGLPSAKLFTDIDSLGVGDVFMITCVGRKITYQVDQILTVLPEEMEALEIDPEQDYCTLVTCTPYGINSHRLLVRGHRIENLLDEDVETIQVEIPERELSEQERIQQFLPYIMIFAAGFFGIALMLPSKKRRDDDDDDDTPRRGKRDRRRGRDRRDKRDRRDRSRDGRNREDDEETLRREDRDRRGGRRDRRDDERDWRDEQDARTRRDDREDRYAERLRNERTPYNAPDSDYYDEDADSWNEQEEYYDDEEFYDED